MQSEAEQLSDLIGVIYDTAFDQTLWPEVLERTASFMGTNASTFAVHDAARQKGNPYYTYGADPGLTERYYSDFVKLNPVLVPISLYHQPGDVFQIAELTPPDELKRTRLYKEWMEPNDWGDFTHCLVEKSGSRFSTFGVAHQIKDSPAGEPARTRLRLLVPHVMRAVEISKSVQLQRLEADRLTAALGELPAGVFLLGRSGNRVYANRSGLALLGASGLFIEVEGVLRPRDATAAALLREAIQPEADELSLARQPVAIPLGVRDGENWAAHVISLRHGSRGQTGRRHDAVAALFVHKIEAPRPTIVELVTAQFKMTAAEARVLFAILSVEGVAQTAAVLGIAEETVKTHLKRIYGKTGTSGQAELFKLLLGFANPMLG